MEYETKRKLRILIRFINDKKISILKSLIRTLIKKSFYRIQLESTNHQTPVPKKEPIYSIFFIVDEKLSKEIQNLIHTRKV